MHKLDLVWKIYVHFFVLRLIIRLFIWFVNILRSKTVESTPAGDEMCRHIQNANGMQGGNDIKWQTTAQAFWSVAFLLPADMERTPVELFCRCCEYDFSHFSFKTISLEQPLTSQLNLNLVFMSFGCQVTYLSTTNNKQTTNTLINTQK